jgi:hypothetical protein
MRLPNFLLIGAAKSGTTSFFDLLAQHPAVFVPEVKEPRFFAYEGQHISPGAAGLKRTVTTLEAYQALFAGAGGAQAVGEASGYLSWPAAPARIKACIPDVKMLAILRDPAERAWSHFLFAQQRGYAPAASFEELCNAPPPRQYIDGSFYGRQLGNYLTVFPKEQLRVFLYEDFAKDPVAVAKQAYAFLGIAEFTPAVGVRRAASGLPRSRLLQRALQANGLWRKALRVLPRQLRTAARETLMSKNLRKPPLPADLRARLISIYSSDIQQTQEIIGRDLSAWLDAG